MHTYRKEIYMAIENVDVLIRLQHGDKIKCLNCGNSYYTAFGDVDNMEKCCHFKCESCGDMVIATKKLKL